MRIGIVAGEYPPMQGGVGAYTRILAHRYVDRGHEVFIYADHRAAEPRTDIHLTASVDGWGRNAVRYINTWAQENALDVVNLQFETAAFGMSAWVHFLPGMVRGVPVITTFHDLLVPYLFPKAGRLRHWIINHLARKSAGVIATNHEDYAQLSKLKHATLIPIGSNIPGALPADYDRVAWRRKANAGDGDFLIGHFGFMNHSKGIEILLEDCAQLIESGYPLKIVMIGGRTGTSDASNLQYADEIDTLIDTLGINQHITWTGFIDDEAVSAYLTCVDTVILPFRDGASYRRGSLMAAIQHGCAIISTQPQVKIPSFVSGQNMLLSRYEVLDENCPPFLHVSPEIIKLYRDEKLRKTLRQGARRLAQNFDWDFIADESVGHFKRVLSHRTTKGR